MIHLNFQNVATGKLAEEADDEIDYREMQKRCQSADIHSGSGHSTGTVKSNYSTSSVARIKIKRAF